MRLTRRLFFKKSAKAAAIAATGLFFAQGLVRPGVLAQTSSAPPEMPVAPTKPVILPSSPTTITPANHTHTISPTPLFTGNEFVKSVPVKFYAEQPIPVSKEDPLGQWGYMGMKFVYEGKQYGAYIQLSDILWEKPVDSMMQEARQILYWRAGEIIRQIDPNAQFRFYEVKTL